jgi:hypothetical protein
MYMETRNYDFDADTLSDLHKEAYGFRPRSEEFWAAWDSADNDGKQAIWDDLLDAADRAAETEREIQQEAIAEFESTVRGIMATVAGATRKDAVRYLHDQYDTHGSDEWLEYELGVPYGYLSGSLKVGY